MSNKREQKNNLEKFGIDNLGIDINKQKGVEALVAEVETVLAEKRTDLTSEEVKAYVNDALKGEVILPPVAPVEEPPVEEPPVEEPPVEEPPVEESGSYLDVMGRVLNGFSGKRESWEDGRVVGSVDLPTGKKGIVSRKGTDVVEYVPSKADREAKDWVAFK